MILFITGRRPGSFFFEYKGKIIYAFPYVQNPSGKVGYYDEDGKTLKTSFLKQIKFSRLTSRFSNNIILCSTDGKHIKELIMLRQEAHNYDHCIRNSYKNWIYCRKRQLCQ
jgi:hypothetical protein